MKESPVVVQSGAGEAEACVIWLHGLGADGHDFEPIVDELALPATMPVRFVFPHAPMMPVTINNGYVMRAWYDIPSMDIGGAQDETGIRRSQHAVESLLEQQIDTGIASERIVLAGFSQGGAIILQAGLRYTRPLAGLMALSTYLPLAGSLAEEKSQINQALPIFYAHGTADAVIPLSLAELSCSRLQQQGYQPVWHEYPGLQHGVSPQEIADISLWLRRVLG
jgi:phospholipase/carboxylesterase